jgi:hypothetical protein
MREQAQTPSLANQFVQFAKTAERDRAPLYARFSAGIAGDPELVEMFATAPPSQQNPTLFFAAVHDLLLSGVEHPLARYYATVSSPEAVLSVDDGDPFAAFSSFCHAQRPALLELLATRSTQTNEVGRCAVLLPVFHLLRRESKRPLAIADLGASAGLNLLFDHFHYEYGTATFGDPDSPISLSCDVLEGTLPDLTPDLPVSFRTGIDLHPMDPDDPLDDRWLLACQWPEHPERFDRQRAALELARSLPDRASVVQGDLVEDLESLVADAPADSQLCILHTWAAAYLSAEQQQKLGRVIAALSEHRPVSWVFAELPFLVPELPVPPAPEGKGQGGDTALVVVDYLDGETRSRRVANVHPHGRWVRWWASV